MLRRLFIGFILLFFAGVSLAAAQTLSPQTPQQPPRPASRRSDKFDRPVEPSSLQALPPLKAVLLVGPIDGDDGSWTESEKVNMDLAAAELAANGVEVHKFYPPNHDWEQIKAAADGAHFLFYRGHGVYWSAMPYPTVGGFYLGGLFVSPDDIRKDLKLAPNAIVMLYGCFTAGSSSIDGGDIGIEEAQRRVAQYSDPFFDIGAAGYYADWFGNAFQMYVRYLFEGQTLGQAYESYFDFNASTVDRATHPDHPDMALWLDKDYWSGYWQYNNAFAGQPDRTLADLFQPSEMTVTPAASAVLAEPSFPSRDLTFRVDGTGAETFAWTASILETDADWLRLLKAGGSAGESIQVRVNPDGLAVGMYQATLRVVADAPELEHREQDITVTLYVVEQVLETYLPLVTGAGP